VCIRTNCHNSTSGLKSETEARNWIPRCRKPIGVKLLTQISILVVLVGMFSLHMRRGGHIATSGLKSDVAVEFPFPPHMRPKMNAGENLWQKYVV
jgi:hypothetical protein